jgi:hypothetical protein
MIQFQATLKCKQCAEAPRKETKSKNGTAVESCPQGL